MSIVYIRFAAHKPVELRRSRLLEGLLARAARPVAVADWRADAFRALTPEAPMPPVGAAAWRAAAPAPVEPDPAARNATGSAAAEEWAWVCVATPVHLSAGMTRVVLPRDGILRLGAWEADALAADFNRVFGGDGVRMARGRAGVLLCAFDQIMDVDTYDPEAAAGQDVFGFQPSGPHAARLRRLMSEIEMWLFGHEVNRSRQARAELPVTGLWLWGGGPTSAVMPVTRGWTAGNDPFFSAFDTEEGWPSGPGPGVIVCDALPGSEEWAEIERRWLKPAADRLRSRGLLRLDLSAGARRISIGTGAHWRIWRRPRPWWESFELAGERDAAGGVTR